MIVLIMFLVLDVSMIFWVFGFFVLVSMDLNVSILLNMFVVFVSVSGVGVINGLFGLVSI